jgi:hypothetical protein
MNDLDYQAASEMMRALIASCDLEIEDRKGAIETNAFIMVISVVCLISFIVVGSTLGMSLSVAAVSVANFLIGYQIYNTRKARSLRTACHAVLMWAERYHKHYQEEQDWFRRGKPAKRG